ncbi:helix-turn-helix domain-containing protein [Nocardioides carbamazepini]|uniref:ArsR/SmtB family transcription factor n=1 Tax=Nocardioides carbamazepini TaxID=2854259 RepID=UPI002149AF54|nr:helix-turn-helix domain-containing protein [Nocardioides carbamazepini]MCR1785128.1 helix-turn-helix domain-containing protein [Nocardioides carbamazepini]
MTDQPSTVVTPNLAGLRALSHPTRLRILSHLRIEGPATATTLAARFGLNSGATSYHLRQLAEHGFVVEDAERGNARDRWWQAAHQETHSRAADARTQEERDVADAFLHAATVMYAQNLQAAMEERPLLPDEWRAASTVSDWVHTVPAAKAAGLVARIKELIASCEDEPGDDAVPFAFQIQAFPVPGHVDPVRTEPRGE